MKSRKNENLITVNIIVMCGGTKMGLRIEDLERLNKEEDSESGYGFGEVEKD